MATETPAPIAEAPAPPEPIATEATTPPAPSRLELLIAGVKRHWIVWLGGLTAALGGLFAVQYSIEAGLLGPVARLLLVALLGAALITASEAVRRRVGASGQTPAALSAAGLAMLYGDVYAAHALYDFLPAFLAFPALAAISAAGLFSGLTHGRFAAFLGCLLGLAAPLLVSSDDPNPAVLFGYLWVLSAGVYALVQHRDWRWLVWMVLAGNGIWQIMAAVGDLPAPIERSLHLLALAGLCAWFLPRERLSEPSGPIWRWRWRDAPTQIWTMAITALCCQALLFLVAAGDGYGGVSAFFYGLGLTLLIALARWQPTQQPLVPIAGAITMALIAAWTVPAMTVGPEARWLMVGPDLPSALIAYATPAAIYAAIFMLGGYSCLWGSSRPGLWASVGAGVPLALLSIVYLRLTGFETELSWASIALLFAALNLAAARRIANYRPQLDAPLAAYASAVAASVAVGAAMALRDFWLTVAMASTLPAIAWIWLRLQVPGLRVVMGVTLAILLARLLMNPELARYQFATALASYWAVIGYGVPALATGAAAWLLRKDPTDRLAIAFRAASLCFISVFMTLELMLAARPDLPLFRYDGSFLQTAMIGDGWLALAAILARVNRTRVDPVLFWGARGLGALGLGWTLAITLLARNPYLTGSSVGEAMIFNLLLTGYLLPAALTAYGAFEWRKQKAPILAKLSGAAALILTFAWMTLEVRHGFTGPRLSSGGFGETETYAYSLAWLSFAVVVIVASMRRPIEGLRQAGFAILSLTIAKVFLIDMSHLTGLLRAASFLGLGLFLIGIGYLYQRLGKSAQA